MFKLRKDELKYFLIKVCLLFILICYKFRKVAYSFYSFCYKLSSDYLSFFPLKTAFIWICFRENNRDILEFSFYRNEKQEGELTIFG